VFMGSAPVMCHGYAYGVQCRVSVGWQCSGPAAASRFQALQGFESRVQCVSKTSEWVQVFCARVQVICYGFKLFVHGFKVVHWFK
jgi:hypothetical protein